MTENEISSLVANLCIKIHKALGPGLLENAYEECLIYELEKAKVHADRQKPIPLIYDNKQLGEAFRADIVIEDKVIVELKAVKSLEPVHYSQLTTYLKLSGCKLGLLVNFGERKVMDGFHRIVNNL